MSEKIRFQSEEERKEQEIVRTLKAEGGIFFHEAEDSKTGEKKCYVNILGVEVETYATKEDIEAIKKELVLSEVDQKLLRAIVESYKLREPLMFEGDPGVGKTFLMKKFVQFIHGKDAPILELVGTPRTSELEILGHWAPASSAKESKDPVVQDTVKRYEQLNEEYQNINDEYDRRYKQLKQDLDNEKISKDEFNLEFEKINKWYQPLQERYATELQMLWQRSQHKTEWEFKEGALLQAYSGRGGKGYILIVDEFNLIPSNYQQIFLQIGGEKGALSNSISFWGNTGKTRYLRGQDTWICFASNFPEKTPGRSEVVAPMTDRLVWKSISSEETEKKKTALRKTAGGRLKKRQTEVTEMKPEIVDVPVSAQEKLAWDKVLDEQLGEQIADVVNLLDEEFIKYYQEVGDSIFIKNEKRRRTQQFEFSGRNPLRFFGYLDHFQVRNPKTGMIDIVETLKKAYIRYYLDRLVDPEVRKKMLELFEEIIEPSNIETIKKSEEILQSGGKELPPGVVMFEGKIMSRKEVFDILVERVSITEEKIKKMEEEEKQKEERELKQYKFDTEDVLESLLADPKIPESIKKVIKKIT